MRRPAALVAALLAVASLPALSASAAGEQWRESGTVVRVVDGDTFDMRTDTGVVRVRLNAIQAPESNWCGGKEAKAALKQRLPKGTKVRLASQKASSGNAPNGVWRLKRTVFVESGSEWVDVAPDLLARGLVFPFPFIGEDAHNREYLEVSWKASEQSLGLYHPSACGTSRGQSDRLRIEVQADGPGADAANSEFALIFNGSGKDLRIGGWMVQDTSPLNAFFFPKSAVLRANDYVVVFSGVGKRGVAPDGTRDQRFFYAGTGQRWNNSEVDIAFLFDSTGADRTGNLRAWRILSPGS